MAISTNGTVIARLAGGLYNTVMSNATYLEVAAQDPSTLANTLYARDFAKSTDLAVATTLVTNLGLSSVAGLDNWVAAQLTAAGSAKGAKIVSLLNDFAGLASDATYGAAATAFNTKVDAALASSQKTGSVEAKFADAGVVAVANATFTLTTGTDTGATFTGGAGNDTFNATVATLGALDSIDGGAGTNTLNITDSASIASQPATVANIQTFNATSTAGSVGAVAVDAKIAAKQEVTYDFGATGVSLGSSGKKIVAVTVGGVTKTVGFANDDATPATIRAAIEQILDEANGTDVDTDPSGNNDSDTELWTSVSSNVVTIKALKAGVALPTISFAVGTSKVGSTSTTGDGTFAATSPAVFNTTVQANQAASVAVDASTVSVPTGATKATISAATTANVASVATAETTVSGTAVTLSGGTTQTITASDSVSASGSTGAVVVTVSKAPATSVAAISNTGWTAGAGVIVRGGTSVSVTEKAGTSTSGGNAGGNATKIQIGSNPADASGTTGNNSSARKVTSTTDGYPEAVGNKSSAPTGDVTTSVKTEFTNQKGVKSVTYGTGDVKIYMNGGTTANVTGATTVAITDINTVKLMSSSTATATPGTSKLSTVNLQGVTGNVGITTDAITNLSVVDSSTSTITIYSNTGANSGALNLSVGNSSVTVQAGNATSVAVTGVAAGFGAIGQNTNDAKAPTTLDLEAAKATSLSFAGTSKISLTSSASDLAKLATITATGSGELDLGTVTTFRKLTNVDASAATGKVIANVGATIGVQNVDTYGLAVKTGSGNDVVTVSGTLTSGTDAAGNVVVNTITLGAGNDTLISSSGSIGSGATVDGGDGTDVVSSALLNAGNATRITNFEVLGLAESGTYDATLLVGATGLQALAASGTYTGVKTTQGLTYVDSLSSGTITLQFPSAVTTGTADAYSVTFAGEATSSATATSKTAIEGRSLSINKIENLTINSGGTGFVANALTLAGDEVRTITVTGSQDLNLTVGANGANVGGSNGGDAVNGKGVSLIDGSALTGKFTVSNAYINRPFGDISTIKGGSGDDSITAVLSKTVVEGGAGNDTITVSASVATTLTGGEGKDTFVLTSATAGSSFDTAPIITTIKDYDRANDTIQIGDADPLKKFVPTSGNSFVEVLTAALGGTSGSPVSGGAAASSAVWFTYGGDTYIAKQDSTNTFGSADIVVKLTGIVDLTSAADNAAGNTTGLVGGA